MFSFTKKIQEFLNRLKRNKGLWFTVITAASLSGILISMYIILTITKSISKDVYINMSDQYKLSFENHVTNYQNIFIKNGVLLEGNKEIIDALKDEDIPKIEKFSSYFNSILFEKGFRHSSIKIYPVNDENARVRNTINSVIRTKETIFGIEVMPDGVFIVLNQPILEGEEVLGVMEFKESIHALKSTFEQDGLEYVFLLNKKMFPTLSLKAKGDNYKDVIEKFSIKFGEYGDSFYGNISSMYKEEFLLFLKDEYWLNKTYYMAIKPVVDVSGVDIGLAVIGVRSEDSSSFVKVVDNVTKAVTSVALGLIISIVLFLF